MHPAALIALALDKLIEMKGKPIRMRMVNGPKFISRVPAYLAECNGIALQFIQPGKPTQNAYIERFNRTYRMEVLDCYVFDTLNVFRRMTEEWRHRYNHERPNESLCRIPPVQFAMAKSQLPLL